MVTSPSFTVVLIDSQVSDYSTLVAGVLSNAQVVVLDPNRDGVDQISEVLINYAPVEHLHIVSHGQPGSIQLGASQINAQTLQQRSPTLNWRAALAENAEVLVYGCQVAAGKLGQQFVQQLSQITGAAIAAATTLVGNAQQGGTWQLISENPIRSPLAFSEATMAAYPGVLATALPNLIYASDDLGSTDIQILDLTTTNSTVVGSLAFPTFAVSRQAETGFIYYVETGLNGQVAYWNPTTNTNTVLGRTGVNVEFLKLAQSVDGTLYGIDSSTPELYAINSSTGAAQLVGNITGGLPPFSAGSGDLAFDPNNADRFFVNVADASNNFYRLYRVDLPTLTATYIGDTGLNTAGGGGLAFGPDGQLYATSTVNGQPSLYQLNPTNATPTLIGPTNAAFSDFSSLPTSTDSLDLQTNVAITTTPIPGGPITYQIKVTNNSPLDVNNVAIDGLIPPQITGVSWNGTLTNGTGGFPQPTDQTGSGNSFNTKVNLGGGSTITYTVTGTIAPDVPAGTTLQTQVTTSVPSGLIDPNFANNTFTLDTVVIGNSSFGVIPPTAIDANSAVFDPTPGCAPGRRIRGTNNDDRLTGGAKSDRLLGRKGADVLRGRGCDDRIEAGGGNDRIFGNADVDRLDGNQGRDRVDGGNGNDIVNGGLGDDRLNGGKQIDLIFARRGNDRLNGNGGNDRLLGGFGRDRLNGGSNDDLLAGQQANDRINGGRGRDLLIGGLGADRLRGREQGDQLIGGRATDRIKGGAGADFLQGQKGDDRLLGNSQADILVGGGNRDLLIGGLAADRIKGGAGRDRFRYRRIEERGDTIVKFQVNRDVIDLARLFNSSDYSDTNRFDSYIKLQDSNLGAVVRVDSNGDEADGFRSLATLQGITANALSSSNFAV